MGETPQIQVSQAFVASYQRRLQAVIAAKVASTKYGLRGVNTYINEISAINLIHLQTFLKSWVMGE
jgi:hypothetical protein